MKKVTLILVMALMGLVSYAQENAVPVVKYGYLSYERHGTAAQQV